MEERDEGEAVRSLTAKRVLYLAAMIAAALAVRWLVVRFGL